LTDEPGAAAGPRPAQAPTAVLLVNLGTPAAPAPAAVRRYLREFLSDPRVVDLPRILWLPILHAFVLNTRPAKSAAKYASIWTDEGSPLRVHTERQTKLLRGYLGERLPSPPAVAFAMRYGEPSIARALEALAARGIRRVLVVPLYPQYAASTTASVEDALARVHHLLRARSMEVRVLQDFHDDPGYIGALSAQLREHREKNGPPDRLLMSFHGLPQRAIDRGDPYRDQCAATARLLALESGQPEGRWQVSFQSRFGAAEWLKPYTVDVLRGWGREGVSRVDVVCPGFVSDCLETLEEIGIEARRAFLEAGGSEFNLLPCLNERHAWIQALADLVIRHSGADAGTAGRE
jgi:ferrochelatase